MAATWILVSHGSAGKVLQVNKNGAEIEVIKEFAHPKTAKKGEDIDTDRPGRSFASAGTDRHAMEPGEDLKDHERRVFAKEMSDYLEKGLAGNKFDSLILTASPDILGNLRSALSDAVKNCLAGELSKDLYSPSLKDGELVEKIRNDLNLAKI